MRICHRTATSPSRGRLPAPAVLLALFALLAAAPAPPAHAQGLAVVPVEIADGLVQPVALAHAGDGSGRLFIVQQQGQILIWDGSQVLAQPFLDIDPLVSSGGELGLLGLAFHPDYETNGEFFVDYTRGAPGARETVVARYRVSADPDVADPDSGEVLLTFAQPFDNHNGGQLAFGLDGFLYVSSGDGGSAADPQENGQSLATPLGKVLRIDVDASDPGLAYAVPPDNPFVGVAGARPEIWAFGLRNPWRMSFDRQTGDLWIADVGQGVWEEINRQPGGSDGGEDYGWDCREGAHVFSDNSPSGGNADCPATGWTDPVLEYQHTDGRCSVTGGYRYRGAVEPRLRGVYLFADFCTGEIFGTVPRCDALWQSRVLFDAPFLISAFGEDEAGEVYVADYSDGRVLLLALAPGSGGPDLAASPDPVDFGTVEAGDTVEAIVTLTNLNTGPESASVGAMLASDPRFVVDPLAGPAPCRFQLSCLPPGGSCTVGVSLSAPAPDTVAETLSLDGNFNPESIDLLAEVVPCASSLDLTLSDRTVAGAESHRACRTLTAGPNVTVAAGGGLTLCGGTRVVLASGFAVATGGGFRAS
ncbi:MAG TPA: PQQ-dependent sugar dehydrogenase, partial [Thermoanaerobaculia bacterium]|nr:PQQ-dependent sugar dehydrogenase [Thermoanaerobaculia bacterium]